MVKKIALEEHFMAPGHEEYWMPTVEDIDPAKAKMLLGKLFDFGEQRIAAMDGAGIERSVLSLSGPGVQAEKDTGTAIRKARQCNDFLAKQVQNRPDRYSGFAHLALQNAKAAADELERCMRDYGFLGALINGHTNGQYLDDPALYPFWERAEALGALVYLHPADPVQTYSAIVGAKRLKRATWEWTLETGTHALRLVFSGHFDRFPKARFAVGHLGETLPFMLWRFDSRAKLYDVKLAREPSQYIRENIIVTLSGMFSAEPMMCSVAALGRDNVLFSADYPFESSAEAAHFMETVPIEEDLRAQIAYGNAARVLGFS